ncbi:rhomboid family intramembrane serine protease [Chloroflexota bacterium]
MKRRQGFQLSTVGFLIIANIILFIATYFFSDTDQLTGTPELILNLGLYRAIFTEEPWRIVTSLFIHDGIMHLLFNMLTLYFFGTYLSRLIGENKFLIVYFLGGILGNVFYMLLGDSYTIVIGASGSVFAVGGALTAMYPHLRVFIFGIVPLPLWIAIIGGFFMISLFPNVAWQAHLGGLLLGLSVGYFYRKRLRYLR